MFTSLIFNIVGCVIMQVLTSIILPDGRIKKFVLSVISLFLFFALIYPICESINLVNF